MHEVTNRPVSAGSKISAAISNPNDPRIEAVAALRSRDERDRTGLFAVDGLRFILQAAEQAVPIQTLLHTRDARSHPVVRGLIADLRPGSALEVTPDVLASLSMREDPQGVIAVVRQQWQPLAMATPATGLCWIAVDSVQFPGNLGTVIRTAECVGAAGLILIGDTADPHDPACVRATMGAIFCQRLVRSTFDDLADWTKRHRAMLLGTSPRARCDYRSVKYDRPTIVFMGSERQGLSDERQALCDINVRIPMAGRADSLNVSVATGVLLYEIFNQRHVRHRPRR